jgi:hypothetical protein
MSYKAAMEAAGARVIAFETFGSYQGDWFAHVEYTGVTGIVQGCYGSCSHCDAFESEFGYREDECNERYAEGRQAETCTGCSVARADYQERLAAFGREYLDNIVTKEEAMKYAKRNEEWDMEAKEMIDWLEAQ